jgi:hypothetical protein
VGQYKGGVPWEVAPAGLRMTLKFYLTFMSVEMFGEKAFRREFLRRTLKLKLTQRLTSTAPKLQPADAGSPLVR